MSAINVGAVKAPRVGGAKSGGKDRLGNIGKRGDRYLRSLFTAEIRCLARVGTLEGARCRLG